MNNTIEKLDNGDFKVIQMDQCVVCDVETNEPKDKHIDFRYNYIEGVGQLCNKCAEKYN
jgi:hypothetical protein